MQCNCIVLARGLTVKIISSTGNGNLLQRKHLLLRVPEVHDNEYLMEGVSTNYCFRSCLHCVEGIQLISQCCSQGRSISLTQYCRRAFLRNEMIPFFVLAVQFPYENYFLGILHGVTAIESVSFAVSAACVAAVAFHEASNTIDQNIYFLNARNSGLVSATSSLFFCQPVEGKVYQGEFLV